MRENTHGVPPMIALGGVDDPILIAHHLIEPTEKLHVEGGAEGHYYEQ
jgi:hypothetical protein